MTVDIEKLEALAKAATLGPWQTELEYPIVQPARPASGAICSALIWQDAYFIAAANPAAVLELTQTIRDLQSSVSGLKTGYEAYERANAELRADCEALRNRQSFSDAFYEVSGLLGVTGARPEAPLVVFRQEVVPALQAVISNSMRYEWLRDKAPKIVAKGPLIAMCEANGSVSRREHGAEMLLSGAAADSAIDAAMDEEAAQ